jgi:hypothetical protein
MNTDSAVTDPDLAALSARAETTRRRARRASASIVAVGLAKLCVVPIGMVAAASLSWHWYYLAGQAIEWPIGLAAAVLFSRWLHRAYQDSPRLGGAPLRFSASYAVASFFIPIANLWQPFQAIRDLHAASDPRSLSDRPQYEPSGDAILYRSSGRKLVPPPDWNKPFPVRAWWTCYIMLPSALWLVFTFLTLAPLGGMILGVEWKGRIAWANGLFGIGLSIASTVLAVLVVRSIQARQDERLRRLLLGQEAGSPSSAARVSGPV